MTKKTARKRMRAAGATAALDVPLDREAVVTAFGRLLEQQGLIPLGETGSLLKSLAQFDVDGGGDSAHDEAQDIAFDAMEAPTRARSIALFKKALKIDPDCVDALAGLARLTSRTTQEEIAALQKAVAAGERFFGKAFFKKHRGDFWSLIETRPYMRARQELATRLEEAGLVTDAIGHMAGLLDLNPNDNQGVREQLFAACLRVGDLTGAASVLKRYKDDAGAVFRWAAVLLRVLTGEAVKAEQALTLARKGNRFVEAYLCGEKKLGPLPEMYTMGSEEEAMLCADMLKEAWASHPDALEWLRSRSEKMRLST